MDSNFATHLSQRFHAGGSGKNHCTPKLFLDFWKRLLFGVWVLVSGQTTAFIFFHRRRVDRCFYVCSNALVTQVSNQSWSPNIVFIFVRLYFCVLWLTPTSLQNNPHNHSWKLSIHSKSRARFLVAGLSGLLDFVLRALRPCDPRPHLSQAITIFQFSDFVQNKLRFFL